MMFNVERAFPKLNKLYFRILSSSVLMLIGLTGGLIPEISLGSSEDVNQISRLTISWSRIAYGQQFTPEETENYAKAGYEVELLRRDIYKEIKNLINESPPQIVCDQQSTIASLQPEVQAIANRYCNQSQQIVQQNNLTVNRFNELKTYYENRDTFYNQVQEVLLKLQN